MRDYAFDVFSDPKELRLPDLIRTLLERRGVPVGTIWVLDLYIPLGMLFLALTGCKVTRALMAAAFWLLGFPIFATLFAVSTIISFISLAFLGTPAAARETVEAARMGIFSYIALSVICAAAYNYMEPPPYMIAITGAILATAMLWNTVSTVRCHSAIDYTMIIGTTATIAIIIWILMRAQLEAVRFVLLIRTGVYPSEIPLEDVHAITRELQQNDLQQALCGVNLPDALARYACAGSWLPTIPTLTISGGSLSIHVLIGSALLSFLAAITILTDSSGLLMAVLGCLKCLYKKKDANDDPPFGNFRWLSLINAFSRSDWAALLGLTWVCTFALYGTVYGMMVIITNIVFAAIGSLAWTQTLGMAMQAKGTAHQAENPDATIPVPYLQSIQPYYRNLVRSGLTMAAIAHGFLWYISGHTWISMAYIPLTVAAFLGTDPSEWYKNTAPNAVIAALTMNPLVIGHAAVNRHFGLRPLFAKIA